MPKKSYSKPKQQSFRGLAIQNTFGGSKLIGKRKSKRPLCTKRPIHLVLKSEKTGRALPCVSFTKVRAKVGEALKKQASRSGVHVISYSVNFNHLHLSVRIPSRQNYVRFIRAFTSHLVFILSATFGHSMKNLFNLRPYTRVVQWGRDFKNLLSYIQMNHEESFGRFGGRKSKLLRPRGHFHSKLFDPLD